MIRRSARRLASLCFIAAVATSCSTLPSQQVAADGDESLSTTTFVSTPPTSAPATTAPPTTAVPTTAAPTTVAPDTTQTTEVPEGELQELPHTGPREAVLFGLIGLAMIVAGRTVLDLFGFFSRVTPTGEKLPPR